MGDTVMLGPPGSVRLPPPIPSFPLAPGTADEWPLWTFLELGALPGAVPCARLHARQVLWEWNLTSLGEGVELLVSELTANAVAASQSMVPCAPVRLWLLAGTAQVLVMVWDACPRPPVPAEVSEDAESGRGLLLVEAMSKRWDWYFPLEGTGGKVVWALAVDERSLDRDLPGTFVTVSLRLRAWLFPPRGVTLRARGAGERNDQGGQTARGPDPG